MKWSFKLGRILGIDVHLHFTFLLLLGVVGLAHWVADRSAAAALMGVLFFAGLFGCVLLHEYGHALAARRYGIATRDITLLPIGGLARLERMPEKASQELVVALAGPLVNVIIATGLFLGLTLTGHWQPLGALSPTGGSLVERLLVVNVFLAVFNLLPAFPMDGGRVLRSLLAMRLGHPRATRIAARIGQGMAVLFGLVGLFSNPMLLAIALFVWVGAAREAAVAEMNTSFTGVPVRDVMLTEFRLLSPRDTLANAAKLLLAGPPQDFPVVDRGAVAGFLTRQRLIEALRARGDLALVSEAMETGFPTAEADEELAVALSRMAAGHCATVPVLRAGQLVGMLTAEQVGAYCMIRAAIADRRQAPSPLPGATAIPPIIQLPRSPDPRRTAAAA